MIHAATQILHARLGRRGAALAILGSAKVSFGFGYVFDSDPTPDGLELLTRWAPIQCWASIWVVCGLTAFTSAWLREGRDWIGFFAALIPPLVWGSAFLWSGVLGSYPRGIALAAWFAFGHVILILWAATVPEYSMPHKARREGGK